MTAADGVTLTVPGGKVVGLVGESGSGKSTLARAAVGLVPLTSGRILLDGADPHRAIQMIFQDPYASLDPRMTIGASIAEAIPRTVARRRAERQADVARLLELVNLDPGRISMRPGRLSGGQRQRVALARALAARPKVIVADEITSALDVSVQGGVLNVIRELRRALDLSMLFISHDLAVVRYVSDYVAVMYLGRIVEAGPTDEVLRAPQHPYTRELLEAAPHRHKRVHLAGMEADPPDPHHPPAGCRFHPRCSIHQLIGPDQELCRRSDPQRGAMQRMHQAACHFADSLSYQERKQGHVHDDSQ
ncbi:oligopeptide/dipeptide ABC transporter ATP-binding protein [Nonomuraea composti]|nr:ABC transporter ATP-binding protein [Nonomuraea sp. FMUSA5-5]